MTLTIIAILILTHSFALWLGMEIMRRNYKPLVRDYKAVYQGFLERTDRARQCEQLLRDLSREKLKKIKIKKL